MRFMNSIRKHIWAVIAVICFTVTGISLLLWRWQPAELSWLEWFIRILFNISAITADLIAIRIWRRGSLAALRHFKTLEEYLTDPIAKHRFPRASDFEEGLVYLPESCVVEAQRLLEEARRCLLVGRSAAGKTILAIALGRLLQETEGYEIFYKDASRAKQNDGRAWYRKIRGNDHKCVLYILDNCHLAPEEVSEFCFQWDGRPPEHAQVILISRPRIREEEREVERDEYFDRCAYVTVTVKSEEIYKGVLEKYAAAYHRQDPERYVALEDDWAQNASLLEAQHSHNLVASRSRLEAWKDQGGRLSAVTEEAVYKTLADKYLGDVEEALPILCALWQYEIPAHNIFVERKLPRGEVKLLEDRYLLTCSIRPSYGMMYWPIFHSEEAREIFEASIYRTWEDVSARRVEAETIKALRDYLKAKPPNYARVYSGLYQEGETRVQHRLLADQDLQACAASQFSIGRPSDTALYLYALSKVDLSCAQELLREYVKATGIGKVRGRLLRCNLWDIQLVLHWFKKVDPELTQDILVSIEPQRFVEKMPEARLQSLMWLVRTIKDISPGEAKRLVETIPVQVLADRAIESNFSSVGNIVRYLQELVYPTTELEELVESIDMEKLAETAETQNLQSLFWLVRTIKDISLRQAKTLLEAIPVQVLADRATESDFGSVHRILVYLQELGYPPGQLETLVESIDMEVLAKKGKTQSFQRIFWFVRAIKDISPRQARTLLEAIPVQALADSATESDFGSVHKILSYLQQLNYPTAQLEMLVESLDMEELAKGVETQSFQSFVWLVRTVKDISPRQAKMLLEAIPVQVLADRATQSDLQSVGHFVHCLQELAYPTVRLKVLVQSMDLEELAREAKVNALRHFLEASTEDLRQRLMEQLSIKDVAAIFDRSPLDHTGSLIQYRYRWFQDAYAFFKERNLARKLAMEPLDEISKFIHRVHQAYDVGEHLASEALDLLVVSDLSERIASTDLEHFSMLLYTANAVADEYPSRLLVSLEPPRILRTAIENSGIRGIQLLILNIANMDERYLQDIRQVLGTVDLMEKLAIAEVVDLGYFLWNVFAYVDEDLSREYCRTIDRQRRSEQLEVSSISF
jgi:hypothetical protein